MRPIERVLRARSAIRASRLPFESSTIVVSPDVFEEMAIEAGAALEPTPPYRFAGQPLQIDDRLEPNTLVIRWDVAT